MAKKATKKRTMPAKTTKKKTNVGLRASRFSPLSFKFGLSKRKKLNRRSLAVVVLLLAAVGGFLIYHSFASTAELEPRTSEAVAADNNLAAEAEVDDVVLSSRAAPAGLKLSRNDANAMIKDVNKLRQANGENPYVYSACMTGIAQYWASYYATWGAIHNNHLKSMINSNCSAHFHFGKEVLVDAASEQSAFNAIANIKPVSGQGCGTKRILLDGRNIKGSCDNANQQLGYAGIGAYRKGNRVFMVLDFASCYPKDSCNNLPIVVGKGSLYPNQLMLGQQLSRGQSITAGTGYRATLSAKDGTFKIVNAKGVQTWPKQPIGKGATRVLFGRDGNFTVNLRPFPLISGTLDKGATHVKITNSGELLIKDAADKPVWSWQRGLLKRDSCVNPFKGQNWELNRIDQGVDYFPNGDQAVVAPCDGVITSTNGSGWPGGVYINFKLTSAPAGHSELIGKCIFIAEYLKNVAPANPDKEYKAGSVIAVADGGHRSTEWGWSSGITTPATPAPPGASHDIPTEGGKAFDRFMALLGGYNHGLGAGPLYAGNSCP